MHLPRVRLTIARLMVLVLAVGLATGLVLEIWSFRKYQRAKLVRQVAEYALREYEEGIYLQDRATYQGQIKLAESELARSIDRLKRSRKLKEKGQVTPETIIADQLGKQQAEFDLEQARMQLEVLEKYTRDKRRKSLVSDIEKARAEEQATLEECQSERLRQLLSGPGK